MAISPRGADILERTAPALSATSDMPIIPLPEPPISASNNAADQANGAAAEMSAEEQAAARAAKQDGTPKAVEDDSATETKPEQATGDGEGKEDEGLRTSPRPRRDQFASEEEWAESLIEWRLGKLGDRHFAVREINAARNQRTTAKALAAAAEAKAAEAQKKLDDALAESKRLQDEIAAARTKTEERPDPRPARDAFETPEAYDEALAEWGKREGIRVATREAETKAAEERAVAEEAARVAKEKADQEAGEAEVAKLNADWTAKKAAAIEKYPDFVAVVEADDALHISPIMAHAMMRAENGADVAYHLATHPEEAAAILEHQNAGDQIFAMGQLAARLGAQRARPSSLPRPVRPLNGTQANADTTEAEPSMDEWGAKRTAELQAQRSPFISANVRQPATRH